MNTDGHSDLRTVVDLTRGIEQELGKERKVTNMLSLNRLLTQKIDAGFMRP